MIIEDAFASLRNQQILAMQKKLVQEQAEAAKVTASGEILEFVDGGAFIRQFGGSGGVVFATLQSIRGLRAKNGNTPGSIVIITGGSAAA